jgi:hypothetical protein
VLADPRKLILQLIGSAGENAPNIVTQRKKRINRHRSKAGLGHHLLLKKWE